MRLDVMVVTPKMAADWLELRNTHYAQRKIREGLVEKYKRGLVNGNWTLTHQGIAFDTKGQLIDGQHRLKAIVDTGISAKVVVAHDVPTSAMAHIDLGYNRTASDVFRAEGKAWITTEHVAIARFIECGTDLGSINTNRSPFELEEMVETHKNAIEFVLQNLERRVRGITSAPVLAAIAVAYYSESDRVRLGDFIRLLVNGVAQDPQRDSVVIKLREVLRDTKGASSILRKEAFLKTQRVIKAYMNGERLSKIYVPTECMYPLRRRALATS